MREILIQLCALLVLSTNYELCFGRVCISSYDESELPSVKASTVRCHSDFQACYTRWTTQNGTNTVTEQGCLNVGSSDICSPSQCVERDEGRETRRNFCCCYRDLCNEHFRKAPSPQDQVTARKGGQLSWANTDSDVDVNYNTNNKRTICSYHDSSRPMSPNGTEDYQVDHLPGTILSDQSTIMCPGDDFCFTVWQNVPDGNDTEKFIIKQGCWQKTDEKYCSMGTCNARKRSTKAKYCCCYGNMCNVNVTDASEETPTTLDPLLPGSQLLSEAYSQYKEKTIIISLVSVISLALIIMGVYLLYRLCLVSKKTSNDSLHLMEAPPQRGLDIEGLELEKQICRGRNSEVWQGTMGNISIAVKMFASNHKQLFLNEKHIYSLPFMEHDNLLKFYGCDERLTMEGYRQFWMVLSFCPVGNLNTFLSNNIIDWSTFCKMALSLVRGLCHLHTEIRKGEQFKPTIAHRDINTRNILVNPDNTCVVGDLGFAIATVGSKLMKNGHYESAEQASLQDVGTLRYMAPELLDGAANLRESETSLKQIDIYALGLVLWEMSTRCSCLYHGIPVPDYCLPYQKEAGIHPTFEEMQILVSRNKVRPKFPEVWRDYNQAVRALKDTMEDCWDHDAEARLTAMCVEERILDMMILWTHDSKHKAPTPLINTTSNLFNSNEEGELESVVSTEPVTSRHEMAGVIDNSSADYVINSPPNTNVSRDIAGAYPRRGMSVSNSTVETLIPPTPSEGERETFQKNSKVMVEKNKRVLQPHQGRNPTVERNTHKKSDEEIAVSGNTLLYGNETPNLENNFLSLNDNLVDSENQDTSLVQSDVLNINTRHVNAPIPYLQNQVHNIDHGNRTKNANLKNASVSNQNTETKSKFLTKLFGPKGFLPISLFHFGSKSNGKTKNNSGSVQSHNTDSGLPLNDRVTNFEQPSSSNVNPNRANCNINKPSNLSEQVIPKDLIISLQKGRPVVRPTNLLIERELSEESSEADDLQLPALEDELGIARMALSQPHRYNLIIKDGKEINAGQHSKSTSDLCPNQDCDDGDNGLFKRPDSLKVKGHNYKVSSSQTYPQNNMRDHGHKIKCRVKTPLDLIKKHGRFSLYDDRLMGQDGIPETHVLKESSASLFQIKKFCDDNANSVNLTERNC